MSVYCSNCGSALPSASRFCSVCGTAVNGYASGYAGYPPASFPPYVPRLVRIIAVLAGIFTCPIAEIAYVACWIGIPEEEPSVPQTGPAPSGTAQSSGQPF